MRQNVQLALVGGTEAGPDAVMRSEIAAIFEQVLERVMAIEDYYDLSIPLDRIAQIQTVADLIRAVHDLRDGAAA